MSASAPSGTRHILVDRLWRSVPLLVILGAVAVLWGPQLHQRYVAWRLDRVNKQLSVAAAAGNLEAVSRAIQNGADIAARDATRHRSALDIASEKANLPLIELLIGAGADPTSTTALSIAVREKHLGLVRSLLEAGADPNYTKSGGIPPLHMSAERGDVEMVELLLNFGANLEHQARLKSNSMGAVEGTPLFAAICCSQPREMRLHMVRVLLERGANPETGRGNAMDLAVEACDGELGDLLREFDAAYGPREAAAFGRYSEVESLVRENPAILTDRYGMRGHLPGEEPTLLGLSLACGNADVAEFLIEQGAPLDRIEGFSSGTLLHQAARGGDPRLIHRLVALGLDVDARDRFQDTPLTDVVHKARPEVIHALIQAGANINARRIDGKTALHLAVFHDRTDIVHLLLAAGANAAHADNDGDTAIDIARRRNSPVLESLEQGTDPATLGVGTQSAATLD
jgi:ankyrin repeat protein